MTSNKPRYRQVKNDHYVKLKLDLYEYGDKQASAGEVHRVVQYLDYEEAEARGMPEVKIKNKHGRLMGLHVSEYDHCDKDGNNEETDSTV